MPGTHTYNALSAVRTSNMKPRSHHAQTRHTTSKQHDLDLPRLKPLHDFRRPENGSEHLVPRLGNIKKRALLRVEVRDVEQDMGQRGRLERFYEVQISPQKYTVSSGNGERRKRHG